MALAAGHSGQGHVKIWEHLYILFGSTPRIGRSWAGCTRQGWLSGKRSFSDGSSYRVRRGQLGGQIPLHFAGSRRHRPKHLLSTIASVSSSKTRLLVGIPDWIGLPPFRPQNGISGCNNCNESTHTGYDGVTYRGRNRHLKELEWWTFWMEPLCTWNQGICCFSS